MVVKKNQPKADRPMAEDVSVADLVGGSVPPPVQSRPIMTNRPAYRKPASTRQSSLGGPYIARRPMARPYRPENPKTMSATGGFLKWKKLMA